MSERAQNGPALDIPSSDLHPHPPAPFVGYSPYAAECPTRRLLNLVGDKWTSLVVILLSQGTMRFGELRREIEGISQKMLTQTLRKLEACALVDRQIYAEVPPRVEYRLTELGRTLVEPLAALHTWAVEHVEEVEAARAASEGSDRPTAGR